MKNSSVSEVFILLYLLASFESRKHIGRIISGASGKNDYPYVVALTHRLYRFRFCTGSLISPDWVLTAAHCVGARTSTEFTKLCRIQYGNLSADRRHATYKNVIAAHKAPNYRNIIQFPIYRRKIVEMPLTNDLALLKIERLYLESFGKISAVDFRCLVGLPVQYVGTGKTMRDSVIQSDPVKAMWIEAADEKREQQFGEAVVVTCPKDYAEEVKLNAALLCVRPKCSNRYQRAQTGDSGGPLLYRSKIVGVTCTVKHRDLHHEAMFTAISPYLDWIQRVHKHY